MGFHYVTLCSIYEFNWEKRVLKIFYKTYPTKVRPKYANNELNRLGDIAQFESAGLHASTITFVSLKRCYCYWYRHEILEDPDRSYEILFCPFHLSGGKSEGLTK